MLEIETEKHEQGQTSKSVSLRIALWLGRYHYYKVSEACFYISNLYLLFKYVAIKYLADQLLSNFDWKNKHQIRIALN